MTATARTSSREGFSLRHLAHHLAIADTSHHRNKTASNLDPLESEKGWPMPESQVVEILSLPAGRGRKGTSDDFRRLDRRNAHSSVQHEEGKMQKQRGKKRALVGPGNYLTVVKRGQGRIDR